MPRIRLFWLAIVVSLAGCSGVVSSAGLTPPANDAGSAAPTPPPFEPLPVASAVTKVKTLLTGLAATQDEVDAVGANPQALRALVIQWIAQPAYQRKMERFFADAFQQSQVQTFDFRSIDNGLNTANDQLLLNLRESFARTVTALIAEQRPFTEVATTTRFMMTTAMMTQLAFADTSMMTDSTTLKPGVVTDRFYDHDHGFSFTLTAKQNIPLADSADPTNKSYLTFSFPGMAAAYRVDQNTATCAKIDPVIYTGSTSFAGGGHLSQWLYGYLTGGNFYFAPFPAPSPVRCFGTTHASQLVDSDYRDWRMVTVQPASASAPPTRFFDLIRNRRSNTLTLYTPRVGYFTTPAFFGQYNTNASNQARVTANQTIIVGLGRSFPSSGAVPKALAPGVDSEHAANPACLSCHWSLDPLRRFFRSTYTINFSQQDDAGQTAVPGTFVFDGMTGSGSTIHDLGRSIAAHPRFKVAWTQKLCEWANSGPCLDSDPELLRVAELFEQSRYDWNALVVELFSSPLLTYRSATETAQQSGTPVAVTRRPQLCATLDSRLGLSDVCGLGTVQSGAGSRTIPAIAVQLQGDQYSRGSMSPIYVGDPDPFYRGAIENLCARVAELVVNPAAPAAGMPAPGVVYRGSDSDGAISKIVHGFMGIDASRDGAVIQLLTRHVADARATGANATTALRSAFTLACISPYLASVGQ